MKKQELIAMVGKESIGGWWTHERIMGVIFVGLFTAIIVGGWVWGFFPRLVNLGINPFFFTGFFVFVIGLCIFAFVFIGGRKVFDTKLEVKKLKTKKAEYGLTYEIEVLGKDGKTHTLSPDQVDIDKTQKTSFVTVGHRVDSPSVDLIIGANINDIW